MNEISANSTTTPILPLRNAMHSTTIITHQALTRALRLSMVARCASPAARCFSTIPVTLASVRTANTPANSSNSSLVTGIGMASTEGSFAWRTQRDQRGAGAIEEGLLRLAHEIANRRTEGNGAQQRYRNDFSFG